MFDLNAEIIFDQSWSARAYARNITEEAVTRARASDGLGRPYQSWVTPLQPRTIGLAAEYAF